MSLFLSYKNIIVSLIELIILLQFCVVLMTELIKGGCHQELGVGLKTGDVKSEC